MPSPFPGMDPYLERPGVWHGFHTNLIVEMQRAIVAQVSPRYIVQSQESLFVGGHPDDEDFIGGGDDGGGPSLGRPARRKVAEGNVFLTGGVPHSGAADGGSNGKSAGAVLEPPVRAALPSLPLPRKHRWVEVRDGRDRRLVTLVELLSPANKRRGPDRDRYARKRLEVVEAGVNLVEIDLLRGGGPRLPVFGLPACDYYALVARPGERDDVGVWPIGLRDPLPAVPVPLRPPDADARLDLQALLTAVYDSCRLDVYAYDAPPTRPSPPPTRRGPTTASPPLPRRRGKPAGEGRPGGFLAGRT